MEIKWTEDLATGIQIVDEQHQELFVRVKSLMDAISDNNLTLVSDTVNFLIDYVVEHFGTEEKFMIKNGYDHFESHRDEHSSFVKKIFAITRDVNAKGITADLSNLLMAEVIDWLVNHINIRDKRLAQIQTAISA